MTKLYSQAKVSLPRRVSEDNKCDHKERMPDESLTMDENHEADWWYLYSARVVVLH